jgi:hypothetical protein
MDTIESLHSGATQRPGDPGELRFRELLDT